MNNTTNKSNLLLVLIIVLFSFYTSNIYSQQRDEHISIADQVWKSADCWSTGTVPANNQTDGNDDIIIDSYVTLDDALDMRNGTYLEVTNYDTLEVFGDVTFRNGSTLLVEEYGVFIIHGDVQNNNNSDDITINGKIIINGNYTGGNGSALDGDGEMEVSGDVETSGTGNVFGSTENCDSSEQDCSSSSTSPLPIELISFNAQVKNDAVHLTWSTATEINNDYFTIERSRDAIHFEPIKKIAGAGNSMTTINYETYDRNPYSGTSYYRLKQTDFDGTYSYSDIRTVRVYESFKARIYPNPTSQNETFIIEVDTDDVYTIQVTDLSGRTVLTKTNLRDQRIELDARFKAGVYIVSILQGNQKNNIKLVVR